MALAGAGVASAAQQTVTAGAVSATFSYSANKDGLYKDQQLTIERGETVAYRAAVTDPPTCGTECEPILPSSMRWVALNGGTEPDLVLSLWTGGASCCEVDQVFSYDATTGTYTRARHDFDDAGASVRDLGHDGVYEFVGANGEFKYQFTDGAASGEPLQIWRFVGGQFVDVTRHYRSLIAADAARWQHLFKANVDDGVGLIAAWAADEDSLGHQAAVARYLGTQARQGRLHAADGLEEPSGERFIRNLDRFLRRLGYLRSS